MHSTTELMFLVRNFFAGTIWLFSFLLTTSFQSSKGNKPPQGFAVVELFTSEGCSSCPAADEALIEVAKEYHNNVFILGFHVDYWNYLGWKDVFSNAGYSERQKHYAETFSLNSIYTPQVVVNGKTQFVGSDKTKLEQMIREELKISGQGKIEMTAKENENKKVLVTIKTQTGPDEIINIALVQLQAQSNITSGENEGRLLHHINIVRDFKTVLNTKENLVYLGLPQNLTKKDCSVIAFIQKKNSLHITGAAFAIIE
jgi:hypothetical protein